jgi:hypothetical protein
MEAMLIGWLSLSTEPFKPGGAQLSVGVIRELANGSRETRAR